MIKEDQELYEIIKDRYSVEEVKTLYEEFYKSEEVLSEEDIMKRGMVSLILEHEGLLEELRNKLYNENRLK